MKVLCKVEYCFYNRNKILVALDEFEDSSEATHVRLTLNVVKKKFFNDPKSDNVDFIYDDDNDVIKITDLYNIKENENKTIHLSFDEYNWSHQISNERNNYIFIANTVIKI